MKLKKYSLIGVGRENFVIFFGCQGISLMPLCPNEIRQYSVKVIYF